MMVSTKGRYALRVMIDLAEHPSEQYIPLKEIADRQRLSEKYLESIIKLLVQGGLLHGVSGKNRGYRMCKTPAEYTVGEVLRLTEDIAPVACLSSEKAPCERAAECRTLPFWQGLDRVINGYLDSVTLADLASENGSKGCIV